ncbi:MAG TPA: hypothetical protein VHY08_06625 [Bacillota bacterium]|nr:hypothetical protein [Bacillota bacterium]
MNQKHLFKKLLVFTLLCALILLAGCNEKSPAPVPPLTTDVIDLSNNGPGGFGFGNGDSNDAEANKYLELKRWQTFTATSYRAVTAVEVKVKKLPDNIYGTEEYSPVLVELYKTTADGQPTGERLAYGLINPDWISTTDFTVVRTGLSYNGLVAGKQYAIVLTQGVLNGYHYEWLTEVKENPGLHFGKYQVSEDGWHEENELGYGWLKVYVASKITPPTRIFIYCITEKKTGNLKGSSFGKK